MTKNSITISTSPSTRQYRRFSAPRSPYPWVWRCHKCRTVYRFSAALNRCLSCSHRFCAKCVSEFDYTGWEHWKSYWKIGSNDSEKDKVKAEDKEDCKGVVDTKQARRISDTESNTTEEIYISELEQSNTTALWDGFENVTNLCACTSLEEQLQLQLQLNMNIDTVLFTPTSSCPTSPCTSSCTSSSSGDDDEEGNWEPPTYYLQRSASVSALDAETHVLVLAFQDEHIDPQLKPSTQEAQETPYSSSKSDSAYGTGEEGETMRDWPLSTSSGQSGYRSVREARKALYPCLNPDHGTGEEGETMRDWLKVGYFSPDDVLGGISRCSLDAVEEKDIGLPLVKFENGVL